MSIPPRDMQPVRPEVEEKQHEAVPNAPGLGWRLDVVDYGADGKATVYSHDDAVVTISQFGLDVEAIDTKVVRHQLAHLFDWLDKSAQ